LGGRDVTINESAQGWVRNKPVLALVAAAAVGLVVGGLVGLGVGYKIEKNRVQKDVQRLQSQLKAAGVVNPSGKVAQRVGQITGSSGNTLTVKTKLQGTQDITTTADTKFEKTTEAQISDVAVGNKVLVSVGGKEVIIVPDDSEIGREVSKVDDDGFTVEGKKGKTAPVKTKNVTKVYKLESGTSADAKVDSDVIIATKAGDSGLQALEVIVLPADSAFNS
jgi:hypothetical protein